MKHSIVWFIPPSKLAPRESWSTARWRLPRRAIDRFARGNRLWNSSNGFAVAWETANPDRFGGIHEPEDALRIREAGADLVAIDSGLVYSGPGLCKRINEAMLHADKKNSALESLRPAECSWFWTLLMGAGCWSAACSLLPSPSAAWSCRMTKISSACRAAELVQIND